MSSSIVHSAPLPPPPLFAAAPDGGCLAVAVCCSAAILMGAVTFVSTTRSSRGIPKLETSLRQSRYRAASLAVVSLFCSLVLLLLFFLLPSREVEPLYSSSSAVDNSFVVTPGTRTVLSCC